MIEFVARTEDECLWEFSVNEQGIINPVAYVYYRDWSSAVPVKFDYLTMRQLLERAVEINFKTCNHDKISHFLKEAILTFVRRR
jgi:hypothetical protein